MSAQTLANRAVWATLAADTPDTVTVAQAAGAVAVINDVGTADLWVLVGSGTAAPHGPDSHRVPAGTWRAFTVPRARGQRLSIVGSGNTYGVEHLEAMPEPDRGSNTPTGSSGGGGGGGGGGGSSTLAAQTITASAVTGPVSIDGVGHLTVNLDEDLNLSFTFPNGYHGLELVVIQKSGGAHTLTLNQVDKYTGGVPPVLPVDVDAEAVWFLSSPDGGTTVTLYHGQDIKEAQWSDDPTVSAAVAWGTLVPLSRAGRFLSTRMTCVTVGAGAACEGDVRIGTGPAGAASTVFTTTANRPKITAGQLVGSAVSVYDVPTFVAGQYLQAGVVVAGGTPPKGVAIIQRWIEAG